MNPKRPSVLETRYSKDAIEMRHLRHSDKDRPGVVEAIFKMVKNSPYPLENLHAGVCGYMQQGYNEREAVTRTLADLNEAQVSQVIAE